MCSSFSQFYWLLVFCILNKIGLMFWYWSRTDWCCDSHDTKHWVNIQFYCWTNSPHCPCASKSSLGHYPFVNSADTLSVLTHRRIPCIVDFRFTRTDQSYSLLLGPSWKGLPVSLTGRYQVKYVVAWLATIVLVITSRSLFYWFIFKAQDWLSKFISYKGQN